MKKILAIALAVMMVMALSVNVFADDTVLFTYDFLFPEDTNGGWWSVPTDFTSDTEAAAGFIDALRTEGAVLVIVCDNPDILSGEEGTGYQYGFQGTDWSKEGVITTIHSNYANGEGVIGATKTEVVDGKAYIYVDAPAFVAAAEAEFAKVEQTLDKWQWVNGQYTGKALSVSVILPETPVAAPADTTTDTDTTDTTDATTTDTTTTAPETTKAPETGLALAVVPAVIALAAVAVSKKH